MHRTGPIPVVEANGPWPVTPPETRPDPGYDVTTNGVSGPGTERTTPLLADQTGPVSVVAEGATRRPLRPFGLHPAVLVAGLLVLAAVGVAVVLAAASGNDGDLATTDDPTVIDDGAADGTDDASTMTDQGSSEEQTINSSVSDPVDSASGPTDDSGADTMGATDSDDGTATGSGETATTVDLTASLEAVTEFRATLDELGITSDDLSAEEIVSFGESACGYATGADGLDGYVEARNEALAATENEELTTEELSSVVDTAVQVFCPEEASRLGL